MQKYGKFGGIAMEEASIIVPENTRSDDCRVESKFN